MLQLEVGGQFLIRPYAEEFLIVMGQFYELVVFTAATEDYANFILDILDSRHSISYKLYRQHIQFQEKLQIKDLSKLGRDLSKMIIVDNIPDNF